MSWNEQGYIKRLNNYDRTDWDNFMHNIINPAFDKVERLKNKEKGIIPKHIDFDILDRFYNKIEPLRIFDEDVVMFLALVTADGGGYWGNSIDQFLEWINKKNERLIHNLSTAELIKKDFGMNAFREYLLSAPWWK